MGVCTFISELLLKNMMENGERNIQGSIKWRAPISQMVMKYADGGDGLLAWLRDQSRSRRRHIARIPRIARTQYGAVIQWHRDTGPALDDATLFTIRKYATTSNKVVTSQSGFDDGPENPFKDVLTHNSPT